jgi:hypothetical protein
MISKMKGRELEQFTNSMTCPNSLPRLRIIHTTTKGEKQNIKTKFTYLTNRENFWRVGGHEKH